jgi:hypothetical protein
MSRWTRLDSHVVWEWAVALALSPYLGLRVCCLAGAFSSEYHAASCDFLYAAGGNKYFETRVVGGGRKRAIVGPGFGRWLVFACAGVSMEYLQKTQVRRNWRDAVMRECRAGRVVFRRRLTCDITRAAGTKGWNKALRLEVGVGLGKGENRESQ